MNGMQRDLECKAIVEKLFERVGYHSLVRLLTDTFAVMPNGQSLYKTVYLDSGEPLMAYDWKNAAENIARHLSSGNALFIDKLISKDDEGVVEFLIEMELRV